MNLKIWKRKLACDGKWVLSKLFWNCCCLISAKSGDVALKYQSGQNGVIFAIILDTRIPTSSVAGARTFCNTSSRASNWGNPHFISSPGEDHFTCRIDFGLYSKTYLMPSPCTRKYNLHEILNLMPDLVSANIGPFKSWPNCTSRAAVQVSYGPCTRLEMLFWRSWTHCACYSVDVLLIARYTRASPGPTLNVSENSQNCVPARGTFACRTRLRQNTDNWFPSDVFPSPDSGTDVTSTISTALADWHN